MSVPITPPCDTGAFIARLGGDAELARQMALVFLRQIDQLMNALRAAIAAGDAHAVCRSAHAVKGSAANFDAAPTLAAAAALEQSGRSGDWSQTDPLLANLEFEVIRLAAALRQFGGSPTCAS